MYDSLDFFDNMFYIRKGGIISMHLFQYRLHIITVQFGRLTGFKLFLIEDVRLTGVS